MNTNTTEQKEKIVKVDKINWIVKGVVANDDYSLTVTFITGEKKRFDFKPLLKDPYYAPLNNSAFFKTAKVIGSSVGWNDDINIAPELLYEEGLVI